jgi:serine protease Do
MARGRFLALLAAATAITWLCTAEAQAQPAARKAAAAADLSATLEATARTAGPAVVEIFTTAFVANDGRTARPADLVTTERGSGSGVIVDADGYIVTNAHVVRQAQQLRVEIPTAPSGQSILGSRRRSVAAEVVGLDLETDLAVLKVAVSGLPTLPLADSDTLRVGQLVLAVGNPLGLDNTVSLGVVSAVARQIEPDAPMIYVQTDAPINAGSSGGPLVNLQGEVVGINTMMLSRSGGYEGVGFAAPSNIVRTVYEHIRRHGRVRRGDIGVRAQSITPALAAGLALPRDSGVVIADVVPRSPAAVAGITVGEIVLALDGKPMENGRQLQVGLYRRFVGDVVQLDVLRDGQTVRIPVAMTERQDPLIGLKAGADARRNLVAKLGILGVALDSRVGGLMPALRSVQGVVVVSTVSGVLDAKDGGLAPGDVIRGVNRTPVAALDDLRAALDGVGPGQPLVLHLERQGELLFLSVVAD